MVITVGGGYVYDGSMIKMDDGSKKLNLFNGI